MPAMAREVIGREEELDAVEALFDGVADGPSALVLSGEPGIGKTILWEAAVDVARGRFGQILVCRSAEAEASLSFAGLSDLIGDALDEVAPVLAPLRRQALEVALLLAEPGEAPPDPRAIGLALLDVLRALAERGPVVLALDDVQWLDPSSASVAQIALRRLRDEPVCVLATLRRTPAAPSSLQFERAFPEERLTRLSLAPLSLAALHHLLKERLALELSRPQLARIQETSGGNPFFALELGRELVESARPSAGRALRVPESLRELLGGRLAQLPTETGDVLLEIAALARPTIDLVAAAHGSREGVLVALDTAVREGVVELDEARLRFVHPLVATICYEQAPLWKRRAAHRALAGAVTDVEERARHLALAAEGPDAVVASYLEAAAEQAAGRGAPAAAAELFELAAELTPAGPTLARARRLRAASLHRLAGEPEQAAAMLEQLLPEVPPGEERADVLFELALTGRFGAPRMIELCDEALAEVPDDDARASRILAYRSFARLFRADVTGGLVDARAALERAERVGDPTLLCVAIARVGQAELWSAEMTPGLVERGAELEERLGLSLEYYESPRVALARILTARGEHERARRIFDELETRAAARGYEGSRGQVLWRLCLDQWYTGHWQRALDYAAAALEIAEQTRDAHQRVFMGRIKALVETDLGLVDSARAAAEEGLRLAQAQWDEVNVFTCLGVLGRLEFALGNLEAAGGYLRELPGEMHSRGFHEPTYPGWGDSIEALIALGELDQGRTYLEQHEERARRVESPWAIAGAIRCRGLLRAAEGDLAASCRVFEEGLAELEGNPYPFERGRILLCLGVVRRQAQQKKAAREAIEDALAIFEELGARLWAEKARAELRRISGRQPASEGLTETERRVAELAAKGSSNREIAAELFMGVSTVEAHLSRIYRKLGIRSRAALAGRLADQVGAAKVMDSAGNPVGETSQA
jgi:ATP/maltotriose-dependent transcriptional regulator MalT